MTTRLGDTFQHSAWIRTSIVAPQDSLLGPDGGPAHVPTITLVPPHRLAASPREVKLLQHFAADVARWGYDIAGLLRPRRIAYVSSNVSSPLRRALTTLVILPLQLGLAH